MFCPKCGTKNVDNAKFCAGCGNPLAERQAAQQAAQAAQQAAPAPEAQPVATYATPEAQPAAQPAQSVPSPYASAASYAAPAAQPAAAYATPAAGGAAVAAAPMKAGANKKPLIIGIAAVIVVILIVLLVRMVACSGSKAPNLVDLATKDTATVSQIVSGYDTANLSGTTYFTTDAKGLSEIYTAIMAMSSSNMDSTIATFQKNADIWFFALGNDYDTLDANTVKTTNPTRVGCYTILSKSSLSAKEAADLLNQVAPYDQCVFYINDSSNPYVNGIARGNGCVSEFDADPVKDSSGNIKVYEVTIVTYSIAEDTNGQSESEDFDYAYSNYQASNYVDFYKK